jgi:signal peptidase I
MTELNLGASSVSDAPPSDKPKRKPSRALRVSIAALLSLFIPGVGQLYVGKIWRGIALALVVVAIDALVVELRLFITFSGLVCTIFAIVLLRLSVVFDAGYVAWVNDTANQPPRNWRKTLTVLLAIFLLVGYPTPDYFQKRFLTSFRAYKISSGSMCPTLCEGERMVADPEAYKMRSPARGELLVFDFNNTGKIFPKRVIGIPGDTVSHGPANTILVNNVPLTLPTPCGKNESFNKLAAEGPAFNTIKVSEGSLFVIGDNLDNSYDSRFFGLVTMDEVKGKPKFIYWSHNRSRIGCQLR